MKAILFMMLASLAPAFALAAGQNGGGGAQIEAAFRLRGYGLITKIADNFNANAICPAKLLEKALGESKIKITNRLINPHTGRPVSRILDAWTVPGYIQLKQSSWKFLVGPSVPAVVEGKSIDMLILHEIYRATGSCDDNKFQLSERVIPLVAGGDDVSSYSESWAFRYLYCYNGDNVESAHFFPLNASDKPSSCGAKTIAACDTPMDSLKKGDSISCLAIDQASNNVFDVFNGDKVREVFRSPDEPEIKVDVPILNLNNYYNRIMNTNYQCIGYCTIATPDETFATSSKYVSLLPFVSPQHPLVVVHDIQNDIWSVQLE